MNGQRRWTAVAAAAATALSGCGGGGDRPAADATATPAEAAQPDRRTPTAIAAGTTTLDISDRLELLIGALGADVAAIEPASSSASGIEIPVSGGRVGVEPPAGSLRHDGGIRFSAAGRAVDATELRLDLGRGEVSAVIGGERLPLLSVELSRPRLSGDASSVALPDSSATLSDRAVEAVNDALGVDLLDRGVPVGELSLRARWP